MTYLDPRFTAHINRTDIKNIFECGAHNYSDSHALVEFYNCTVFAFEADREHVANKKISDRIFAFDRPLALYSHTGKVMFGAINLKESIDKNDGAGSILKLNYNRTFGDNKVDLFQNFYEVDCITIDDFVRENSVVPDMLCLDAQGSELAIFKGSIETLSSIKYIITELQNEEYYIGNPFSTEIDKFLKNFGFRRIAESDPAGSLDALYKNEAIKQ